MQRRKPTWLIAIVAVATLMAVLSTACSSDSDDSGASPDTSEASEINRDGDVAVGIDLANTGSDTGFTLDPTRLSSNTNDPIQYLIWGRLFRPLSSGQLEPDLAEGATIVDPNTIEVTLREGLTWHDGTPFTAESVKSGLDRTLASQNPGLTQPFFSLGSVEVTDPTTVTLRIKDGTAPSWYDSFLGSWQTTIVRPDEDFTTLVGAGPMKVASYTPQESFTLERFEDYWNVDAVNFAGMNLVNVLSTSPQSGTAALQGGQVDMVYTTPDQIPAFTGAFETIAIPNSARVVNMPICKKFAPLDDPKVRQAISKGIDRDAINDAIYEGTALPGTETWPEGNQFFTPEVADIGAYDPEGAKALLAEAGYPDGVSVDLYPLASTNLPEIAQIIQAQLADIGVTVNLNLSANYVNDFLVPQKPGIGMSPGGSPGRGKLSLWTGGGVGNACKYDDPEMNDLVTELAGYSDSDPEAKELWDQINTLAAEEMLSIFVVFQPSLGAYNSDRLVVTEIWPVSNYTVPDIYTSYIKN